jgi:tetratricopeptide (TPR) repeat protein
VAALSVFVRCGGRPFRPNEFAMSTSAAARPKPDAFQRAVERLNGRRPVKRRLAQIASLVKNNALREAERELGEHLAGTPDDADAISLLARTLTLMGRRREALVLLERCLALAPDFDAARFNYADALFKLNQPQAALEQLDLLLAGDGDNPLYRQLKANVFETIGENERSLAICEALAAENPLRADSWISYGHAARAVGQQDKAVAGYRRATECRPSCGQAWWALANMKTVRFGDGDIAAMQGELARTDIAQDDRITLQFSLAKAYEDKKEYEKSFEQYAKANAAVRVRIDYDPDTLTDTVAANKRLFTPEFLARHKDTGCKAPDPIFILGRPRSGSTLIEQILASHSQVEGTAELPYITALAGRLGEKEGPIPYGTAYLKVLPAFSPADFTAMGEDYMRDTRVHRKTGRPFFIDKKPANFSHIGLIHLILPNAKIIDARRHPCASSFSMFKTYGRKGRLRLAELGRFYRDYVELMAHFDRVAPGRIHRVIYENMVADPEGETRRLLDYLALPFEESCLRFYETERTVLTPSSEQVRKPISGEAVDHWRHFEPWLAPLIRGLGSVYDRYPDVPEELGQT